MKIYGINKAIAAGLIAIEVKFSELAEACNQPQAEYLNIDMAMKKYLKQKGIKVIDTNLRIIAHGQDEVQLYKKKLKEYKSNTLQK